MSHPHVMIGSWCRRSVSSIGGASTSCVAGRRPGSWRGGKRWGASSAGSESKSSRSGLRAIGGAPPDIGGALVEWGVNGRIDGRRPAAGQAGASGAQGGADALVELCRDYADVEAVPATRAHLVVRVPLEGPAEIVGI